VQHSRGGDVSPSTSAAQQRPTLTLVAADAGSPRVEHVSALSAEGERAVTTEARRRLIRIGNPREGPQSRRGQERATRRRVYNASIGCRAADLTWISHMRSGLAS